MRNLILLIAITAICSCNKEDITEAEVTAAIKNLTTAG